MSADVVVNGKIQYIITIVAVGTILFLVLMLGAAVTV
jgi:hypothetical protein